MSLLVKQTRLAKITLIPGIVQDAGSAILAKDDSGAENMQGDGGGSLEDPALLDWLMKEKR